MSVIAEIAARGFGLKAAEVFDALKEREAAASTGVGHGVAAPHARLAGLDQMRGIFVRLEQPVDFGAVDDQPVDLLFAIFSPQGDTGSAHLRALARVSRVLRQASLREQIRKASSADAIRALLVSEARSSAA